MMKRLFMLISLLFVLLMSMSVNAQTGDNTDMEEAFKGQVQAPEFPAGVDWLNVENPLTMAGLKGKIVLLDFWTYGCINCIHMIPVLEALEEKFPKELIIIGVHSAKFENEGDTNNIREIIQRYDLKHPVINDKDFAVWGSYRSFGVNAWPTFAIIGPNGNVVAVQSGEIPFEAFDQFISGLIQYFDGVDPDFINREPIALAIEGAQDPGTPLLYPGKVRVDTSGNRLFIADSNHHRIVVLDLKTYEVLEIIGTGQAGYINGTIEEAQFNKPQGMEINGQLLYVADTNNHTIREIDLEKGQVRTIAGTGEWGRGGIRTGTVIEPTELPLRSPWDVRLGDENQLYIAMAGTHQIYKLDLAEDTLQVAVGNGREAALNETLLTSELAQPSGLYYQDGLLYFADSESSTIRVADFNQDTVSLVSGTDQNNLFKFGDVDGNLGTNLLQHPLGVVGDGAGHLYIADTYNSKIKVVDTATLETVTLSGSGEEAYLDGAALEAAFNEPGGIDYADGKLYVADTNNQAIRIIDLASGQVESLQIANPELLAMDEVVLIGGNSGLGETIQLEPQTLPAGTTQLQLKLDLPEGYKINDLIQSQLTISGDLLKSPAPKLLFQEAKDLETELELEAGEGSLTALLTLYYCESINNSLCFIDEVTYQIPLTVADDNLEAGRIVLERSIKNP